MSYFNYHWTNLFHLTSNRFRIKFLTHDKVNPFIFCSMENFYYLYLIARFCPILCSVSHLPWFYANRFLHKTLQILTYWLFFIESSNIIFYVNFFKKSFIIQKINSKNRNHDIIHIRCNGFWSHRRMAFGGRRRRNYYRILLLFGLEIRIVSRGRIWQVLLGSTVWNALFEFFFFCVWTTYTRNVRACKVDSNGRQKLRTTGLSTAFVCFWIHHFKNDPHDIVVNKRSYVQRDRLTETWLESTVSFRHKKKLRGL